MLKSRSKKKEKADDEGQRGRVSGQHDSMRATKIDKYPRYPERRNQNHQSHVAPCVMRDTLYLFAIFPWVGETNVSERADPDNDGVFQKEN
jgi:hypothetical protein